MLDDLPSLPMDLPEVSSPAMPRKARRPTDVAPGPDTAQISPTMIMVDATTLSIDDRFGLDIDALSARYADQIADARARLINARPQIMHPLVLRTEDDRYTAFSGMPVVIAAIELARASNAAVTVNTILHEAIDGEALLRDVFENPRGKSLFEKARYIAGCEAKYGTRRAWMRAEGIAQEKWEPRFSKIAKIAKLDKRVLARIDPHTISNAEIASRIVDACNDAVTRRIVIEITEAAAATAKGPLNAALLFKRIDAVLRPTVTAFATGSWENGICELRGADGTVVATLTRHDEGWSISGADLVGISRAMLNTAFDALKT
ncbi:hypothetical protein SFC76_12400 [Sphingomonas sp. CD22]|uniref:hypothetical protein n=1 Tax=Sphingomonas sp. CD22 TaxID=3100214 RepID=UPI0010D6E31B|nr:hypothetical protein [Sphingomonas sp. CD22]MEA1085062.1 hypothetical protein [Sphingomonas sp. CD22]RYD26784.1 MAG: hypothetical protein EOP89_06270 [Xanthomonadaceae bacterium]